MSKKIVRMVVLLTLIAIAFTVFFIVLSHRTPVNAQTQPITVEEVKNMCVPYAMDNTCFRLSFSLVQIGSTRAVLITSNLNYCAQFNIPFGYSIEAFHVINPIKVSVESGSVCIGPYPTVITKDPQ